MNGKVAELGSKIKFAQCAELAAHLLVCLVI
jgi:hypothetical protein